MSGSFGNIFCWLAEKKGTKAEQENKQTKMQSST